MAYGYDDVDPSKSSVLDKLLIQTLESQHAVPIQNSEKALIVAYAKDILFRMDDPDKILRHLNDPDTRKEFANNVVLAATSAALDFERQLLEMDCKMVLKKLTDPDVKLSQDERSQLVNTLKNGILALKRMSPSPAPGKAFTLDKDLQELEKLLKDDRFIDKLINMKEDVALLKNTPKGPEPTSPTMQESKELKEALENLLGFDPQNPGLRIPVLTVIGNFMGVPDNSAALSADSPIHNLSGDLEIDGRDLHMDPPAETASYIELEKRTQHHASSGTSLMGALESLGEDVLAEATYAAHSTLHNAPELKR